MTERARKGSFGLEHKMTEMTERPMVSVIRACFRSPLRAVVDEPMPLFRGFRILPIRIATPVSTPPNCCPIEPETTASAPTSQHRSPLTHQARRHDHAIPE